MKTIHYLLIMTTIALTSAFSIGPFTESNYTAVLMTRAELEKSIEWQSSKVMETIGKIYKKDQWIFISEKYKGIHVIDNTNPASPVKVGFIRVPGCMDIAVNGNSLYTDNSVDLVTIDISAIPQIQVTERVQNVFPEPLPPDLQYIPGKFVAGNRPENTIIVEWKKIQQ